MNVTKLGISLLVLCLVMTFFVGYAYAAPIITVETEKTSYYLGEDVVFTGTNTISDKVFLFLNGANTRMTYLLTVDVLDDDIWATTFDLEMLCRYLDSGTYKIYAATDVDVVGDVKIFGTDYPYNTVSVALTQPYISASGETFLVAPGDPLVITGTAELPKQNSGVLYYIFGEDYFYTNSASVTGTSYAVSIDTTNLANGQYFMVVQHPMYDRVFNIGPVPAENGAYDIKMNDRGDYAAGSASHLFNTADREGAAAAEALCQALYSQNIDDTYVRVSFIVDSTQGKLISISDVSRSSSYSDGESFTVSGVNTDSTCVHLYLEYPSGTRKLLSDLPIYASTNKTWTTSLSHVKTPEAGTYTIYAVAGGQIPPDPSEITNYLYAARTMDVFLTVDEFSPDLVRGESQFITGNATGTTQLLYYIFGTNFFVTNTIPIDGDGSYWIYFNSESKASGQYFVVIQHPGSNRVFNIGPVALESGGYDIKMNAQGDYASGDTTFLYNTNERQGTNAAEALGQALNIQNIDDIYVKLTFKVSSPYLTANSFSPTYTKGELIEITGTANPVSDLNYYVFGRENFLTGTIPIRSNGQYDLKIDTNLIEGNDFYVVIQHPMYDGLFNVGPVLSSNGGYDIKMNTTGGFNSPDAATLFNTLQRQGGNATNAICRAIDSYHIDDVYTKLYFLTSSSSTTTNILISPGFTLQRLTVSPEPSPTISEGTPISVLAYLTIAKDAITTSGSLKLSTDIRQSTSWTVDVYKGTYINNQMSEETLITSLYSERFAYTIYDFVLNYDQPITFIIHLTGLYPEASGNITALKIDGPDFTYSYEYGPTHQVPSIGDELNLRSGWNFISIPKTLNASNNTFGSLFGNVETSNKNILAYNAQTRTWAPILNKNDIIQPLNGYWIYSAEETTISLTYPSDPAPPSVKTLYPGWNAVGLSADESVSAKTALAGTSWRTLLPWDLADGNYESAIVNGGSDANSPDRLMTLGNGYWLYVDAQSTMTGLTA